MSFRHLSILTSLCLAVLQSASRSSTAENGTPYLETVATVKIVNSDTGRVLTVETDDAVGQRVVVTQDSSDLNNQWRIIQEGDFFRIVNVVTGDNLVAVPGAAPETAVRTSPNRKDLKTGDALDNQLWSWIGARQSRRLKNKSSGLVLDIAEKGSVVQSKDTSSPTQYWHLIAQSDLDGRIPSTVATPTLHLINGDFCTGTLVDCNQPDLIRWNSPAATRPFDFNVSAIGAIYFPPHEGSSKADGDWCVELAGGDILFGSLIGLTADQLVLDASKLGQLHIDRSKISRLERVGNAADDLYFGPQGTLGWQQFNIKTPEGMADDIRRNRRVQQPPNANHIEAKPQAPPNEEELWRDEAGQLVTDHPDAAAYGDFGASEQFCIEFEISWASKADFVLALCLDGPAELLNTAAQPQPTADAKLLSHAFRFEVWDGHLVVVRESDDQADLADLLEIKPGTATSICRHLSIRNSAASWSWTSPAAI